MPSTGLAQARLSEVKLFRVLPPALVIAGMVLAVHYDDYVVFAEP